LLQHTPSFWRNLRAFPVVVQVAEREVAVLQRRIELSHSTLLDVTLNMPNPTHGIYNKSKSDLFELISKTGIERWRSLTLSRLHIWRMSTDVSLEDIFTGKLLALRSLRCDNSSYPTTVIDPFIPIYQLIIQSSPPIKQLTIDGTNPSPFQGSPIFRQLHELNASAPTVSQLVPLHNLKKLTINEPIEGHDFAFSAWPPLPTHTVFESGLTREELNTLSRQSVKEFAFRNLIGDDGSGVIIDFPELTSLSITEGGFCSIGNIFAPKLTNLQITAHWGRSASRKKEISDTIFFLRERPDNIMLRPTTLNLNVPVNTTTVLAILQHWPQLQHFTLTFGDEFAWNATFPNAFTRKKSPVCPELTTLRLILRIKDFWMKKEQWKKMVMSIYQARRNTPLQTIEWMFGGSEWHSPSTEAQDL
jgi:hypothetical protein